MMAVFTLLVMPATALAVDVSLDLSTDSALVGDSVTASGQADPDTFVSIKIVDSTESIVYYEAVKSGQDGSYSHTFIVPDVADGLLEVVSGYGPNVAVKDLFVGIISQQVSLNLNKSSAQPGDTVTASGTADASSWILIEMLDNNQNVLLSDQVQADSSGNYSLDIVIPEVEGVLQVVASSGDTSASRNLTIGAVTSQITLTLNPVSGAVGDSITASGTATPNTWVSLKVLDSNECIVFFDAIKADSSGNYSLTFVIPDGAAGVLNVMAGYGEVIASQDLIITQSVDECFIATAAFGSKFEPSVALLRAFRDEFLLSNAPGSAFVAFYYRNSPPIANYIAQSDALKAAVRVGLIPFIAMAYLLFHPLMLGIATGLILFAIVMYRFRRRKALSY
jgi:hypothetical protein